MAVSWGAYLASWYVWFMFSKSYKSAENLHRRIKRERISIAPTPPAWLRKKYVVEERQQGGYPIFDISPKTSTSPQSRDRVLYVHGGSLVFDMTPTQWDFVAAMVDGLQTVVTVPMYPLGPEHTLLEMYAMLQPLHDDMAAAAASGTPLWLVGDSAGGTLALGLSQHALDGGRRVASRLLLISPLVDSTYANPEVETAAATDPFLGLPGQREATRAVTAKDGIALKDPRISPIFGTLRGLPPMMVFIAEMDLLGPDASRFVGMAEEKGCTVTTERGEGMIHDYAIMPFYEGEQARKRMWAWLRG